MQCIQTMKTPIICGREPTSSEEEKKLAAERSSELSAKVNQVILVHYCYLWQECNFRKFFEDLLAVLLVWALLFSCSLPVKYVTLWLMATIVFFFFFEELYNSFSNNSFQCFLVFHNSLIDTWLQFILRRTNALLSNHLPPKVWPLSWLTFSFHLLHIIFLHTFFL